MAIEVRHSRTATLVDSPSNPGYDAAELQAADWNAAHPVTADGMGLLFSNSAGDVAETMTVDMGTLTASTPLTFKQTWDNATNDVTFEGVRVLIEGGEINGTANSALFSVAATDGVATLTRMKSTVNAFSVTKRIDIYEADVNTGSPVASLSENGSVVGTVGTTTNVAFYEGGGVTLNYYDDPSLDPTDSATYGPAGISRAWATNPFTLPPSTQTAIASWAGAPTTSDIAAGYAQIGKDTSTSNVWLAVNDGGTIKKVQLT